MKNLSYFKLNLLIVCAILCLKTKWQCGKWQCHLCGCYMGSSELLQLHPWTRHCTYVEKPAGNNAAVTLEILELRARLTSHLSLSRQICGTNLLCRAAQNSQRYKTYFAFCLCVVQALWWKSGQVNFWDLEVPAGLQPPC